MIDLTSRGDAELVAAPRGVRRRAADPEPVAATSTDADARHERGPSARRPDRSRCGLEAVARPTTAGRSAVVLGAEPPPAPGAGRCVAFAGRRPDPRAASPARPWRRARRSALRRAPLDGDGQPAGRPRGAGTGRGRRLEQRLEEASRPRPPAMTPAAEAALAAYSVIVVEAGPGSARRPGAPRRPRRPRGPPRRAADRLADRAPAGARPRSSERVASSTVVLDS